MKRIAWLWLLWAAPVLAESLPDAPRLLARSLLAARDAPACEFAWAPRPALTLGGEAGIWRWFGRRGDWRLSGAAVVGLDNATSASWPPQELLRSSFGLTLAYAERAAADWEFSAGLFRSRATTLSDYNAEPLATPRGIAFGGGGVFVPLEVARRQRYGDWWMTLRAGDHLHLTGLSRLIAPVVGDVLGSFAADALYHAPQLDIALSRPDGDSGQWQASLHAEAWIPVDASAKTSGLVRALAGYALVSGRARLLPFLLGEIGGGPGLLVNRREYRLGVGVRYAPN